jgi:hypothetical protein
MPTNEIRIFIVERAYMKTTIFLICLFIAVPAFSQNGGGNYRMRHIAGYKAAATFTPASNTAKPTSLIPPDFSIQHFGFFCRQELNMHQRHIPISFRLGSMEYCNRMEGKPGYR